MLSYILESSSNYACDMLTFPKKMRLIFSVDSSVTKLSAKIANSSFTEFFQGPFKMEKKNESSQVHNP